MSSTDPTSGDTLFLTKLPDAWEESNVVSVFGSHEGYVTARVRVDKKGNRVAFIEFSSSTEAENCKAAVEREHPNVKLIFSRGSAGKRPREDGGDQPRSRPALSSTDFSSWRPTVAPGSSPMSMTGLQPYSTAMPTSYATTAGVYGASPAYTAAAGYAAPAAPYAMSPATAYSAATGGYGAAPAAGYAAGYGGAYGASSYATPASYGSGAYAGGLGGDGYGLDMAGHGGMEGYGLEMVRSGVPSGEGGTLFVEGLPPDVTKREVSHLFRLFQGYESLRIFPQKSKIDDSIHHVLCFVEFRTRTDADVAMRAVNGYNFNEDDVTKRLVVTFAKQCEQRRGGGGRS